MMPTDEAYSLICTLFSTVVTIPCEGPPYKPTMYHHQDSIRIVEVGLTSPRSGDRLLAAWEAL
jgi:hypothetical protein